VLFNPKDAKFSIELDITIPLVFLLLPVGVNNGWSVVLVLLVVLPLLVVLVLLVLVVLLVAWLVVLVVLLLLLVLLLVVVFSPGMLLALPGRGEGVRIVGSAPSLVSPLLLRLVLNVLCRLLFALCVLCVLCVVCVVCV